MPTQLTIILPGLTGPTDTPGAADGLSLPALETLLSRADRVQGNAGPLESLLFSAFGHAPMEADLPVAAVTRAADMGGGDEGWWLRADPVQLRADRDTLVFMGDGGLALSDDEADTLVRELDQVFQPRGWHLCKGTAQRWYLRLPEDPGMKTHAPAAVWGRDIRPYLPSGEQASLWHAVLNEAQMQLHMSPVNQRREALGLPVVNSVWLWGGGHRPRVSPPWDHLWCDHVVGRGLARLSQDTTELHPVPGHGVQWLTSAVSGGSHLVVLDNADTDDPQRWRGAVQGINDRWMAPLLNALRDGSLTRLALVCGAGTDFIATPSGIKRWWRRPRRLRDCV